MIDDLILKERTFRDYILQLKDLIVIACILQRKRSENCL